jgi:hypothetical protein
MLTPDPQRQWFVYFNEKELGPFAEKELLTKIAQGEFDTSAYVFTDGMTDWALVSDTPVLYKSGPGVAAGAGENWKEQSTKSIVAAQGPLDNPFDDLIHEGDSPPVRATSGLPSEAKAVTRTNPVQGPTDSAKVTSKAQVSHTSETNTKSGSMARSLSGAPEEAPKVGAEPTLRTATTGTNTKVVQKPASKPNRTLLLVLLLVVVGAAAYYWQNQMQGSLDLPSEVVNETQPEGESPQNTEAQGAAPEIVKSPKVEPTSGAGAGISDVDWAKLKEFRAVKEQKGPTYMLSPNAIGGKFPIVVGALSPLIESEQVHLAVFPDPERSLMAIPKIWYLRASSLDGFFSAGPLNLDGKELPPGRYIVLVQTTDGLLGETSFELGLWPDPTRLAEIKTTMTAEMKTLAGQEREALVAKLKEIKAALAQLKAKSQAAVRGPRGAPEWKAFSKAWYESLLKAIRDQRSVTVGPMFYPAEQLKLLNFMENVRALQESFALVSRGGAKLLAKTRNQNLGKELAAINKEEATITSDFASLDKITAQPLVISVENVKKGLEYFVSTGFK